MTTAILIAALALLASLAATGLWLWWWGRRIDRHSDIHGDD